MDQLVEYPPVLTVEDRVEFYILCRDVGAETSKVFKYPDVQLLHEIAVGRLRERYPHTLSSLADKLDMPRQTTSGRVSDLVDRGLVRAERDGPRMYLTVTPEAIDLLRPIANDAIQRVLDFADRVRSRTAQQAG